MGERVYAECDGLYSNGSSEEHLRHLARIAHLQFRHELGGSTERAGSGTVAAALVAVLVALVGNIGLDPRNVEVFAVYLLITLAAVSLMLRRVQLMRLALRVSEMVVDRVVDFNQRVRTALRQTIDRVNSVSVVYFTKGDDLAILPRAARNSRKLR